MSLSFMSLVSLMLLNYLLSKYIESSQQTVTENHGEILNLLFPSGREETQLKG